MAITAKDIANYNDETFASLCNVYIYADSSHRWFKDAKRNGPVVRKWMHNSIGGTIEGKVSAKYTDADIVFALIYHNKFDRLMSFLRKHNNTLTEFKRSNKESNYKGYENFKRNKPVTIKIGGHSYQLFSTLVAHDARVLLWCISGVDNFDFLNTIFTSKLEQSALQPLISKFFGLVFTTAERIRNSAFKQWLLNSLQQHPQFFGKLHSKVRPFAAQHYARYAEATDCSIVARILGHEISLSPMLDETEIKFINSYLKYGNYSRADLNVVSALKFLTNSKHKNYQTAVEILETFAATDNVLARFLLIKVFTEGWWVSPLEKIVTEHQDKLWELLATESPQRRLLLCEDLIAIFPKNDGLLSLRALAMLERGEIDDAIETTKSLSVNVASDVHAQAGKKYVAGGSYTKAIPMLEQASEFGNAQAAYSLAQMALKGQKGQSTDHAEVAANLLLAVQRDPNMYEDARNTILGLPANNLSHNVNVNYQQALHKMIFIRCIIHAENRNLAGRWSDAVKNLEPIYKNNPMATLILAIHKYRERFKVRNDYAHHARVLLKTCPGSWELYFCRALRFDDFKGKDLLKQCLYYGLAYTHITTDGVVEDKIKSLITISLEQASVHTNDDIKLVATYLLGIITGNRQQNGKGDTAGAGALQIINEVSQTEGALIPKNIQQFFRDFQSLSVSKCESDAPSAPPPSNPENHAGVYPAVPPQNMYEQAPRPFGAEQLLTFLKTIDPDTIDKFDEQYGTTLASVIRPPSTTLRKSL